MWYKDSIFYALHIRSFFDSTNDGVGDINGLTQKLDYLEDLGITAISLLPFYPSPLKDDGYDISNFQEVHPDYGTLKQLKQFLTEAHKRSIKVVIDFICNHTSTEHPTFQRSRYAPEGSPERDAYIWSKTPDKFEQARLIFSDFESSNWEWDPVAKAYYFHRFYQNMADLNYDNPLVREEIRQAIDFWLGMGVDGLRLSSIMYIFKKEGTNCENLPEVHEYVKELRQYVSQNYKDKILIADAILWPEELVQYFGNGDECHASYHYPLMPRLFMALQTEDRYPVIDILEQTPEIPEDCQWMLLLRNHDDMTLSMVTEEERDYLYKVFAKDENAKLNQGIRRRLAPLLNNDRRKIELLNILLFSLPGTPVIYYGDEIGMGDNIYLGDRKGIRTPMQWSADKNAGFSQVNPQRLFLPVISDPLYRYENVNVENQENNPSSLLNWMKNLIAMRKRLKAFSQGKTKFLETGNSKILAFTRIVKGESILVVTNLSKYSQAVSLDLQQWQGIQPTEIFSQNRFFPIEETPYRFTLSPYGYYWFLLEKSETPTEVVVDRNIEEIETEVEWSAIFDTYTEKRQFEKYILPNYLKQQRWFGGKSRTIVAVEIPHYPSIKVGEGRAFFLNIKVRYTDGLPETYFLPVFFISGAEKLLHYIKREKQSILCFLKTPTLEGAVIDAIYDDAFRTELFWLIKNDREVLTAKGKLQFEAGKMLQELGVEKEAITSEVLRVEQSNTSVIYNEQFFFKIYRKLDTDINPDLELVRFLSDRTDFENAPRYGGGIQYQNAVDKSFTILGLLQNKIPNQGEAWTAMLEALKGYYERILELEDKKERLPSLVKKSRIYTEDIPRLMQTLIGEDLCQKAILLGQRTAEMHIALASDTHDPDFVPEVFTPYYQRSVYSGHRKIVSEKLNALASKTKDLPENVAKEAQKLLALREDIVACFAEIFSVSIDAAKTRIHGDYHLGQVLYNGKDFYIIDFEGEPMLSISERRLKKTPFKDVAGMMRSFHYAAYGQLYLNDDYQLDDMPILEKWAQQWFHYVSQLYLTAYLDMVKGQPFIPEKEEHIRLLLRSYTLEKAIYEVGYEMNARPRWLKIPVQGVLYVMEEYLESMQ